MKHPPAAGSASAQIFTRSLASFSTPKRNRRSRGRAVRQRAREGDARVKTGVDSLVTKDQLHHRLGQLFATAHYHGQSRVPKRTANCHAVTRLQPNRAGRRCRRRLGAARCSLACARRVPSMEPRGRARSRSRQARSRARGDDARPGDKVRRSGGDPAPLDPCLHSMPCERWPFAVRLQPRVLADSRSRASGRFVDRTSAVGGRRRQDRLSGAGCKKCLQNRRKRPRSSVDRAAVS